MHHRVLQGDGVRPELEILVKVGSSEGYTVTALCASSTCVPIEV